jgi:hypothetical protein
MNVIDGLANGKAKGKAAAEDDSLKIKDAIFSIISNFELDNKLKDLCLVKNEKGNTYLCLRNGRQLNKINPSEAESMILAYLYKQRDIYGLYNKTHAKMVREVWEANRIDKESTIDETAIKEVAFQDDVSWHFDQLPFDRNTDLCILDLEEKCPTYMSILNKMATDDQPLFINWIGSLFHLDSVRSQYLYLHGDGKNGKSTIVWLLCTLLKQTSTTSQANQESFGRFGIKRLHGQRLLCFLECDDIKFASTPFIKSITGDDYVISEKKGIDEFDKICLNVKLLFTSNRRLTLSHEASQTRRLLYVELLPLEEGEAITTSKFRRGLLDEAESFFNICANNYHAEYPSHGEIEPNFAAIDRLVKESESCFQEIFDRYFEEGAEHYITNSDLAAVWKALGWLGAGAKNKKAFKAFCSRNYGLEWGSAFRDKQRATMGIRLNDDRFHEIFGAFVTDG